MEDIENMMKCRAIFLYDIALLCNDVTILENENLDYLLPDFIKNYLKDNFEIINLIYCLRKDKQGNLCIYEESDWQVILLKYLKYFSTKNDGMLIKIFNDIGDDIVSRINRLAELFYEYVLTLRDISLVKIKS